MPNWCFTTITINHEDEDKVKMLENLIKEWTSKDYMDNGFGHGWLGNIVLGSEVGTVDKGEKTDLRCRGRLDYIDRNENELTINTETAWEPMLQMWKKVVDRYLPGAEIIYFAEECGMELFCTNDPAMINCYYVDSWDCEDIEIDCEASEKHVIKDLQKLLKTTEGNIDVLLEMLNESEWADKMSIHKWEFAEINEWE